MTGPLRRLPAGDHALVCCHVKFRGPQQAVVLPIAENTIPQSALALDEVKKAKWMILCIPCSHMFEKPGTGVEGSPYKVIKLTREIALPG